MLLCERNHDLDDLTHFYCLIYKKEVSGCFMTNCVMVALV